MSHGYVSEIFSSLQGEGPCLGERQIFIRLAGCPWRCRYCDTPASLSAAGRPPMAVEQVLDEVHHLQEEREHRTVSLTGGEPLTQTDFLAELLPALRRLDRRTYLETSGTQPELLKKVVGHCDVIAMDVKLPSAIGREFWDEHAAFLKVAGAKAFLKAVLTADTTDEEWRRTLELAASADPAPTLVLQPVTTIEDLVPRLEGKSGAEKIAPPPAARLAAWWEEARRRLPDARLIPQLHPIWGLP